MDYGLDEIDDNSGCLPALETKNGLDFTLPLLKGLQSCANLKYLKFNFNRNFDNMGYDADFSVPTCIHPLANFMENISTNCQKISTLELDADTYRGKYEGGIHLKWITWIPKFQKLKTMIVNAFMVTVAELEDRSGDEEEEEEEESDSEDDRERFSAQKKVIYDAFFQNPMVNLKDLIMTDVTLFLHEDFLSRIFEVFPNLENYDLNNKGNPNVRGFIGIKNLVPILESLCRIKRVAISHLVLALSQSDDLDSAQTKVIFENAAKIVNENFDQKCGPLKIVDEKHGYVLTNYEREEAIVINTREVNGRKVVKKSYNEKEDTFVVTLEGQNEPLNLPKELVKSLVALYNTEDRDINDSDHMINDGDWELTLDENASSYSDLMREIVSRRT